MASARVLHATRHLVDAGEKAFRPFFCCIDAWAIAASHKTSQIMRKHCFFCRQAWNSHVVFAAVMDRGSDLTWCPLLWIVLPFDPFVFLPYFLHREDKMRIRGNLTLSFHLLLKRLQSNSGLPRGFLSSSHGCQITWSLENYTGTHTWTPYYVTTALTGAISQCKQLHLKLIDCLKSIFNSSFWLVWSWK